MTTNSSTISNTNSSNFSNSSVSASFDFSSSANASDMSTISVTDITGEVKTTRKAIPQIYAYTTPEITRHNGWTKIGYTERNVAERVKEQTHTVGVKAIIHWHDNATYAGTDQNFRDTDFHGYLKKLGVQHEANTEWFQIEPDSAELRFYEFRKNRGVLDAPAAIDYQLRDEQTQAVQQTLSYASAHKDGEFLWNAKPRFGKTLTSYDFCRQLGAKKILIVTNRPAIANSWYDDYVRFVGTQSGLSFISNASALQGKPYCLTHEEYEKSRHQLPQPVAIHQNNNQEQLRQEQMRQKQFKQGQKQEQPHPDGDGFIEFVTLQDLKGSIDFGGKYSKLEHIAKIEWDVLIIDEAHEGVDTHKTDVAFDQIHRNFTLHLSGTPFKAIANEKFPTEAIFNWTYADEQKAKNDWNNPELSNPYENLPRLNLFTYQMSEIVAEKVALGVEIDGETLEYAFDLNEFFATNQSGSFIHNREVDRFLDALTTQKKFPFSTPELRNKLRHTFWLLNRVDSAKALAKKLKRHPVFKDYEIVLAAGDGKLDDEEESTKAFDKVQKAIDKSDKTITLSVGQLTTGVTVPEWTAVLMLSNLKSPSLYMQAAFRAQNPCLFKGEGGKFFRKENAYVFDFDPARTLTIFEEFANDLYSETAGGGGTQDERKQRVRTLLNFFPVLGEDENGEMIKLDAERVLSIPRKIRSQEVVRRGFMSDFLFQNIAHIFRAPAEVIEVLQKFTPYKAPRTDLGIDRNTADELSLNDDGEVDIPNERVIGQANSLFGDKKYGEVSVYDEVSENLKAEYDSLILQKASDSKDTVVSELLETFESEVTKPLVETAREIYGQELGPARQKKIERMIKADTESRLNREIGKFNISRNRIEQERANDLKVAETPEQVAAINCRHDEKLEAARVELVENLQNSRDELIKSAGETLVREMEISKQEAEKQILESRIKDRLRGFSRTIPSFLMAYGDEHTTLATFDRVVPSDVFKEVTSITVEEFRLLRDGGEVSDPETGEKTHFSGQLFDPVVFDDSVREFIDLRARLANYFDESLREDIFDYVPPQKTNQIFTPRNVVRQMVDLFEQENPGCFADPEHTFADLYMKSGMYIAEIIKRFFNSSRMRELYPAEDLRLKHILENQVFGIAPTEIIYNIATNYILGFNNEVGRDWDTNFVVADSAKLAEEGKLADFVQEKFGHKLSVED